MQTVLDTTLFYFFAAVAVAAAVNVLVQRRVFYSALSLIVCLTSMSGIVRVPRPRPPVPLRRP